MKTLAATVILSIFSAFVSVYSVTELCGVTSGVSIGKRHHSAMGADAWETKPLVQQWVNR